MVVIKKYSNRRLYDTSRSRYLNIQELAEIVREGSEVKVLDASTGDDLTQPVLLQVLIEVGGDVLPSSMLHRIIRASGEDPWQKALRQQIATGMKLMAAQMDHVEKVFFKGKSAPPPAADPPQEPPDTAEDETPPSPAAPEAGEELDELRARLAALEARLKG